VLDLKLNPGGSHSSWPTRAAALGATSDHRRAGRRRARALDDDLEGLRAGPGSKNTLLGCVGFFCR
jgi:hypothetical protein